MRGLLLPVCLVLLATAPAAFAEDCDRNDDSQSMLNICADADYQAADAKLNAAYKNIVGSSDPKSRPDGSTARTTTESKASRNSGYFATSALITA